MPLQGILAVRTLLIVTTPVGAEHVLPLQGTLVVRTIVIMTTPVGAERALPAQCLGAQHQTWQNVSCPELSP